MAHPCISSPCACCIVLRPWQESVRETMMSSSGADLPPPKQMESQAQADLHCRQLLAKQLTRDHMSSSPQQLPKQNPCFVI